MIKNIDNYFILTSSYLLYFLPFALLTGPFVADLIIIIIDILFIFLILRNRDFSYFNNYYSYILILFNLYLIISSIASEYTLFSLESSLVYFRFYLFSLAVFFLIDKDSKIIKNFGIYLFLSILIATSDGYYQYIFGNNIFGISPEFPNRMTLLLSDKSYLGGYISRLFPLLVAIFLFNSMSGKSSFLKSKYIIISIFIILIDVLLFLTGERTAFVLQLITTVALLLFLSKYKYLRLFTFLISIILIITITNTNNDVKERNVDQTIEQLNLGNGFQKINAFSTIHEGYFAHSIEVFKKNIFTGSGPNTFRKTCAEVKKINECSTHPHNNYIQIISETGVLGLAIILLMILPIFIFFSKKFYYIFTRSIKVSDYQTALMICIFLSIFPLLPTQNFFNNYINIIYFLPVGFLLHSFKINKKDR